LGKVFWTSFQSFCSVYKQYNVSIFTLIGCLVTVNKRRNIMEATTRTRLVTKKRSRKQNFQEGPVKKGDHHNETYTLVSRGPEPIDKSATSILDHEGTSDHGSEVNGVSLENSPVDGGVGARHGDLRAQMK
jgi:hypothetical protein